ncbi:MAG: hypothetical protein AAF957_24925 [Planctomycetota bacterium]
MSAVRHATATLATALAVSLLPACQTSEAGRRYPTEFAGTSMTDRQLRTKLYDFVVRTSGRIEGAAERIERESESPEVQLFALRWKLFSIPATQMAAFDADPAIGAVDSWVLAVQTREFLETDVAEARFGEHRDLALATARVIEDDIESILDALSTEERADVARERVYAFAKENPLGALDGSRPSAAPELNLAISEAKKGIAATAASVEDRLLELSDRATVYASSIPRQARWEAQVVASEIFRRADVRALTDLALSTPDVVAAERSAVLEGIRGEREAVMADVEAQRIDTLERLQDERDVVLAAIDAQRDAVLGQVREERQALQLWASAERAAAVAQAGELGRRTVDHALWRGFLYALGAAGALGLLLGGAFLLAGGELSIRARTSES